MAWGKSGSKVTPGQTSSLGVPNNLYEQNMWEKKEKKRKGKSVINKYIYTNVNLKGNFKKKAH